MVNASKILTVSYGTFSCTLEGFDEPFSTMRSIAEYFRDLAADDRYFGAEPPTPDADMLHRIAEREIQRRVEARVDDTGNGVVLRQVTERSETAAPQPVAEAEASAPETPPTVEVEVEANLPEAESDAVADSVAAKLARIRAAVARSRSETEPLLNSVFSEDEHAEPDYKATPIAAAFAVSDAEAAGDTLLADTDADAELNEPDQIDELDITGMLDTGTVETEEEISDETPEAEAVVPEAPVAEDDSEPEVVEVEEVLAEPKTDEIEVEEETVDLPEETAPAALKVEAQDDPSAEVASDDLPDVTETEEPDLAAMLDAAVIEAAETEAGETAEDDNSADLNETPLDLSAVLGIAEDPADATTQAAEDLQGQDASQTDDAPQDETPVETLEQDSAAAEFDIANVLAEVDAPETDLAETDPTAVDAPLTEAADDLPSLLLTGDDRADLEVEDEADQGPALAAPRVRVMKMSREEFDAQFTEVEEEDEAETSEMSEEDGIRQALGETGLSPEDEADLISELAEVERDTIASGLDDMPEIAVTDAALDLDNALDTDFDETTAEEATPETVSETLEALVAEATSGTQPVAPVRKADDASVDRLLARADTALEDGEGTRRRSAIAHLKAAVAAVRADGDKVKEEAQAQTALTMNKFRDDLAHAVRPDAAPSDDTIDVVNEAAPAPVAKGVSEPSPVRPTASVETKTERPRRAMPPLMLVSEQRIDKETEADDAEPVRPRRIHTADLDKEIENELFEEEMNKGDNRAAGNYFSEATDFTGYVADTGAEGVQELLEASLAFGLYVEGAEFNSRPQIMKRMLSLHPDGSVTREDGLRAFGVLLREGRIHRVQRGHFLLPENSRFYQGRAPEANMA